MKLRVRLLKLRAGKPIAFLHDKDAQRLTVHSGDRIEIKDGHTPKVAIVDIASGLFHQGEIALSEEIASDLRVSSKDFVQVELAHLPQSAHILQSKKWSKEYTKSELKTIMKDIINNVLTEAEIAYFVSGVYHHGLSMRETLYLTEAIYETGDSIKWKYKNVADKHSIGGIPGNRTTPIIVAICASAGVIMPKTSSRAITSAAGTADTIETLAKVDFSISDLRKIVRKTGACLAWGGSLGLAPADDRLIRVEKILDLDPEPQLIASILSKKLSVGSKFILIDIPYGLGAKVSKQEAIRLKHKFIALGKKLKLKISVILTDGSQPIGNGIGPSLEMKDVLRVLQRNNPPLDLERKSVILAGAILEMVGKAKKGKGKKLAQDILESGEAFKKFREIIEAQNGHINTLPMAKFNHIYRAPRSGKIKSISNREVNHVSRIAGCPQDKAAGIYLYKHVKSLVKKNDPIFVVYSESKQKLSDALKHLKETGIIALE